MFIETLKRFAQWQGKKVGNIVHIGAGDCEELEFYEMQNPDQIILVDADASVCKRLQEQTDGMENCRVIQMAVARRQSDFTLHQYNNIKLNSNLSPKELEKNFPGIKLVSSSQIQSVSLDSFLDGLDLVSNTSKISVLVLDNCGMNSELLADNLCPLLKGFDYIIIRALRYGEEHGINLKAEKEFELLQLNESGLFYEFVYKQNTFYIQFIEQNIEIEKLKKELATRQREINDIAGIVAQLKSQIAVANPYGHNRKLTTSLKKDLQDFFSIILKKEKFKRSYIDYLATKAIEIEKKCVGRLATTIQDAVVRQVIAESVEDCHLGVLEIGALFGVNLAILYNHCSVRFKSLKVVGLDPVEGFYGKGAVDALLNIPINEKVFQRNMELCGVHKDDFALIKRYSTEPEALIDAQQFKINLLIIDGDHSYEGVKFDYENYLPLVSAGGYILFDDYNTKEWPGVQTFVDEKFKNDPRCDYLGAYSRTAIGRKL